MERGNLWADVKGVFQEEDPQEKSTNVVIVADWIAVILKLLQWKWSEESELFSFKDKSTLRGGGAYARKKPFSISKNAVITAFEQIKANKDTYRINKQSIKSFELDLKNNLYKLWNRIWLNFLRNI